MRSEAEIKEAIRHQRMTSAACLIGGDLEPLFQSEIITRVLEWVAGEDNSYGQLLKTFDEDERAAARARSN